MRPAARLVCLLSLVLALAVGVSACATRAVAPLQRVADETVGADPEVPVQTADDDAFVRELTDGHRQAGFETASLTNLTQARRVFPGALDPHDTLGRRLVAVIHAKSKRQGAGTREILEFVYEGRLLVMQAVREGRAKGLIGGDPSREETRVGDMTVEAAYAEAGRVVPRIALVTWSDGKLRYTVQAPGMTKADAVRIARSMVTSTPGVPDTDTFFVKAEPSIATSSEAAAVNKAMSPIFGDAKGRPYFVSQQFPDDARTREAFEKALFPRETLGRRLVAIVETHEKTSPPRQLAITLVYQRGLEVFEQLRTGPVHGGYTELGRETTVGSLPGRIWTIPGEGGGAPTAHVEFESGSVYYAVNGAGMSEADVLAVARSLKP